MTNYWGYEPDMRDELPGVKSTWREGGTKELSPSGRCREIVADEARIGLVYGVEDQDNKANARLIAAAPALLQACLSTLKFNENPTLEPGLSDELVSQLNAAVDAAKVV